MQAVALCALGTVRFRVAGQLVVTVKVHGEKVFYVNLFEEYACSAGKIVALTYVDREHGHIHSGVFRSYAVNYLTEIRIGLCHFAFG